MARPAELLWSRRVTVIETPAQISEPGCRYSQSALEPGLPLFDQTSFSVANKLVPVTNRVFGRPNHDLAAMEVSVRKRRTSSAIGRVQERCKAPEIALPRPIVLDRDQDDLEGLEIGTRGRPTGNGDLMAAQTSPTILVEIVAAERSGTPLDFLQWRRFNFEVSMSLSSW